MTDVPMRASMATAPPDHPPDSRPPLAASLNAVMECAAGFAGRRGGEVIGTEDLMMAILTVEDNATHAVLEAQGLSVSELRAAATFVMGWGETDAPTQPEQLSALGNAVLGDATDLAVSGGCPEVGTLHLLRALLSQPQGLAAYLLESPGRGCTPVRSALDRLLRLDQGERPE